MGGKKSYMLKTEYNNIRKMKLIYGVCINSRLNFKICKCIVRYSVD